ncbi:MAG: hypothetical protein CSB55_01500 [Candidatus Cloacimonadota bacterium]|nr:MAG: hypothetical protein CSB55_01500 [Candidatus Cloacimonadota bacterium]
MIFFTSLFCLGYTFWIMFLGLGIFRVGDRRGKKIKSISLIIAARNEENNLPGLLEHLANLNYPKDKFEIIIADDRSSDDTPSILRKAERDYEFIKTVTVKKEEENFVGKKNALAHAIEKSSGEILAFTDADCFPKPNWLLEINAHFADDVDIVSGYSPLLSKNKNFFAGLKNMERSAVFAVNAGSFGWHIGLTTAARNFAYRRSLYDKVNGFSGISHIRSGDDDLMLQKMSGSSRRMNFMFSRESIVPTSDKTELKEQIHLETRRASKFKYYPIGIKLMLIGILIFYLLYVIVFFQMFFCPEYLMSWLVWTAMKLFAEFFAVMLFLTKMKEFKQIKYLPFAEFLYIPYFIFFGLKGTFGNYKWKN